eukprot:CAMPEP_0175178788 /NCGR_PEP_ID=MMETSP0087-20121206/35161_1 /TAXON_ID=136419 /ORGANISM="Unknown Unknown, Strain D1" /LENGTH=1801 /DNA_ID=CAMNT_0016470965 /DNA_START=62 /DNA_END=5468 /DNA_ORIENTATION=-
MDFNRFKDAQSRVKEKVEALDVAPPGEDDEKAELSKRTPREDDSNDSQSDFEASGEEEEDFFDFWGREQILELAPAERREFHEQLELEHQYIGRTNIQRAVKDKSRQPRNLEEEGIYVAPPVPIPDWNLAKLEARLVREDLDRNVFFNEDGQLKLERSYVQTEGWNREGNAPFQASADLLQTEVHAPVLYSGQDLYFAFKANIHTLKFTDHPLFSEEDLLCRALEQQYVEYKRRDTVNLIKFYADKIESMQAICRNLRNELDQVEAQEQQEGTHHHDNWLRAAQKYETALRLVIDAKEQRDREEYEQSKLFRQMYRKWLKIKQYRKRIQQEYLSSGLAEGYSKLSAKDRKRQAAKAKAQAELNNKSAVDRVVRERTAAAAAAAHGKRTSKKGRKAKKEQAEKQKQKKRKGRSESGSDGSEQDDDDEDNNSSSSSSSAEEAAGEQQEEAEAAPADQPAAAAKATRSGGVFLSPVEQEEADPPASAPGGAPAAGKKVAGSAQADRRVQEEARDGSSSAGDEDREDGEERERGRASVSSSSDDSDNSDNSKHPPPPPPPPPAVSSGSHSGHGERRSEKDKKRDKNRSKKSSRGDKDQKDEKDEKEGSSEEDDDDDDDDDDQEREAAAGVSASSEGSSEAEEEGGGGQAEQEQAESKHDSKKKKQEAPEEKETEKEKGGKQPRRLPPLREIAPSAAAPDKRGGKSKGRLAIDAEDEVNKYSNKPSSKSKSSSSSSSRPGHSEEAMDSEYVGFPLMMKVVREATKKSTEQRLWRQSLQQEVAERRRLYRVQRKIKYRKSKGQLRGSTSVTFNEEEVTKAVEDRMTQLRRVPGAPKFSPIVHSRVVVTPDSQCPYSEVKRRKAVHTQLLYCVLLVNQQEVTRTAKLPLDFPSFSVSFDMRADIQLLATPRSVTCEVYQSKFFGDHRLAEILIPVPEFGSIGGVEQYQFSGIKIDPEAIKGYGLRHINGYLQSSVFWATHDKRLTQIQNAHQFRAEFDREVLGASTDLQQQRKISRSILANNVELDPNDPRNTAVLEKLRRDGADASASAAAKTTFRASRFKPELILIDKKYYVRCARGKILKIRSETPLIQEAVPFLESEIPDTLFQHIHLSTRAGGAPATSAGAAAAAAGAEARGAVSREVDPEPEKLSLTQLMRERAKILSLRDDVYDVAEVVREGSLPDFYLPMQALDWLFNPPKRPLRVKRHPRNPVANPSSCNLIVQVISGSNFPVRTAGSKDGEGSDNGEEDDYDTAYPLVEVSFQSNTERTVASSGDHPAWNDLLVLPLAPPNDSFAISNIQRITDMVHFNVFDSITAVHDADFRHRKTTTTEKQLRWMGCVSIPFATIYMNDSIGGDFELDLPLIQFGYSKPDKDKPTLLRIYATLDPCLATPPPVNPHAFPALSPFFVYTSQWLERVTALNQCKERNIQAIVSDINGFPVLMTRFISPQEPPPNFQAPKVFSRFVSLIPFVEDFQQSEGSQDVWCTSREFLGLLSGDWEEHANLLCNYFLWYEKQKNSPWKAFVIMGTAIPEGDTLYVVRMRWADDIQNVDPLHDDEKELESTPSHLRHPRGEPQKVVVFNAVTGKEYDLDDSQELPLTNVGCIFNDLNIWANTQKVDDPRKLSYDLYNTKAWDSLFPLEMMDPEIKKKNKIEVSSVQEPILYRPPSSRDRSFEERAFAIERIIEKNFERWRDPLETPWDYGVCKVLRDFLEKFERIKQGQSKFPDIQAVMETLRNAYDGIVGFPLEFVDAGNPKYLEDSQENPIVQAVMATRIQENEDPKTVYALAVYIYPYVNGVSALWVYVASLT